MSQPPKLESAEKLRPRREWLMVAIQPVASAGVARLAAWRVNPLWVVAAHAALGFLAALGIAAGPGPGWRLAAILLIAKTLLDNMDGGLARASGQITEMGRYFDTVMDFWANLALFVALSRLVPDAVALSAFILLTLILSWDYNAERLYKTLRTEPEAELRQGAPDWLFLTFETMYRLVFAPQDRLIESIDRRLFYLGSGRSFSEAPGSHRFAWNDLYSTASLVNLGLSTQLTSLALLLLLGRPDLYVVVIFLQALYLVWVQAWRVVRFRRYALNHDSA